MEQITDRYDGEKVKENLMKKITMLILITGVIFNTNAMLSAAEKDTERLIGALKAENIGWRVDAARLLGESGETEAIAPLIRVLKTDKIYSARISAAVALAKIGDAKALKALKYASKNDKNLTVRTVSFGAYKELERSINKLVVN